MNDDEDNINTYSSQLKESKQKMDERTVLLEYEEEEKQELQNNNEQDDQDKSVDFSNDNIRYTFEKNDENNDIFKVYDLKPEDIKQIDFSFITRFKAYYQKSAAESPIHEQRVPFFGKMIAFKMNVMHFNNQKEKSPIIEPEIEDFMTLLDTLKRIYFRLPRLCYKFPHSMQRPQDREHFKPGMYRNFVRSLWDAAIICCKNLNASLENIDKYRAIVPDLFAVAATMNCLGGFLNTIRNQTESGQVPDLLKEIILREYNIEDYISLADHLYIKLNRELIIQEKVICQTYKLSKLLEIDLQENPSYELLKLYFTDLTQVVQNICEGIFRLNGQHLNQTHSVMTILQKCIIKPYSKLCERIQEQQIDEQVLFDYEPTIGSAVHTLLETIEIFFHKKAKISQEKQDEADMDEEEKDEKKKKEGVPQKDAKPETHQQQQKEKFEKRQKEKREYYSSIKADIIHKQKSIESKFMFIIQILDPERRYSLQFGDQNQTMIKEDDQSLDQHSVLDDSCIADRLQDSMIYDPSQSFIFGMQKRLEDDSKKGYNQTKDNLKMLLIRVNIDQSGLANYMKMVFDEFEKFYKELKADEQADFTLKKEFVGRLHHFLVNCLTKIRAHNFDKDLVEQVALYLEFLTNNNKESSKKLRKLRLAFVLCFQKLEYKFKNDEKLIGNEEFKVNFENFRAIYEKLNAVVKEYFGNLMQEQLVKNEDYSRLRKLMTQFIESDLLQKSLKSIMNSVYDNFRITIKQKHFSGIMQQLKEDLKVCLKIYSDQDVTVQGYGLSGAGILFINSTIKAQARVTNAFKAATQLQKRFESRNLEDEQVFLCNESWFQLLYSKEGRYFYLKLVKNKYSEAYNGLIFKLKFQHYHARKDTKLSFIIYNYLIYEKYKIKKLAFFWIFFLKINGLIGQRNGYLSGNAYLMILINYLQQQYILPNMQQQFGEKKEIVFEERLSKQEAALIKSRLRTENIALFEMGDEASITKQSHEVNYYVNLDFAQLREQLSIAKTQIKRRTKTTNPVLLMKFFKFLTTKLPERNQIFQIQRGKIFSKRLKGRILISVKNPFIPDLNEGRALVDKNKFNKLITKLKEFMRAAATGQVEKFIININTKELEVAPEEEGNNEAIQQQTVQL